MRKLTNFLIFLSFGSFMSFGQMNAFDYKRELNGVSDKWHKIDLPIELFSKTANDLSDIRIFGLTKENDTIEVPYILKSTTEEIADKKIAFKIVNTSSNASGHFITFENSTTESINQIQLDFKQRNFDWRLKLEGSQNQNEWFTIAENYRIVSLKNDLSNFQFTKLTFPDSKYRYFRVSIESNEKPNLISASIEQHEVSTASMKNYSIIETKTVENKKLKQTEISIELQYLVPVSQIRIAVQDQIDYYRPITIQYLSDSIRTEMGWRYTYSTLSSGTLNSLEQNELTFSSAMAKKLKIIIENHDNRPLHINSIQVAGYNQELFVRFAETANYFLVYGNKNAFRPNYDIDQFANNIPKNLTTLSLGKEQIIDKEQAEIVEPLFKNKAWLWIVLSLLILILGWFSLSMIRKKE